MEDSVYIAPWARRRGVGRLCWRAVIAGRGGGSRQMVAIIGNSTHVASIGLHRQAGFRVVGTLENVGWKLGRWLDTVIMQRALGAGAPRPRQDPSVPTPP